MSTPADPKPTPLPAPTPPIQARTGSTGLVIVIALFGLLAGGAAVFVLKSPAFNPAPVAAVSNPAAVEAAADTPEVGSPRATAPSAPLVSKWTGGVRRSRGRDLAVFELEARNEVAVWGKVVRPLLTVRCIAGTTEVFVYTQSAAALEGRDGRHTVKIGFDGSEEATERWLASADYDALFAENGIVAAKRMTGARTMRFGFTPFNGAPVTASFDVAGIDEILPKLSKACRW